MFYSKSNFFPIQMLEDAIYYCNMSVEQYFLLYGDTSNPNKIYYKKFLKSFKKENKMPIVKALLPLTRVYDVKDYLQTFNAFIKNFTNKITEEDATDSKALYFLLNKKIKLINQQEKKEKKENIIGEDRTELLEKIFNLIDDTEEKVKPFTLEDLINFQGNFTREYFYKYFFYMSRGNYINLIFDYAQYMKKNPSISHAIMLFSITDFLTNEKIIYSLLIALQIMIERAEPKKYLFHYQKMLCEYYFRMLAFIENNYSDEILKIYKNIPDYEKEFTPRGFRHLLSSINVPAGIFEFKTQLSPSARKITLDPDKKDEEIETLKLCRENPNFRIYTFGFTGLEFIREEIENGWYLDNPNIEYIIERLEKKVEYLLEHHTEQNFFQRTISLIFYKNSLKIRYNEDNNKWNKRDLIDQYFKEVKFIYDHEYNYPSYTSHKCIEMLAQIQSFYNSLPINEIKTIKSFYEEKIKAMKAMMTINQSDLLNYLYGFIYKRVKNEPIDIPYETYKSRLYMEQAFMISTQTLFDYPCVLNFKYKDGGRLAPGEMLNTLIRRSLEKRKKPVNMEEITFIKNYFDLNYIY